MKEPGDGTGRTKRTGKRVAGQHALSEGNKRVALWSIAEIGASVFSLKGVEKYARERVKYAERTWVAGGEAEQAVGAALDALRERGFYIFHDVALSGIGNIDHVVIGPTGTFAIETKSHRGRVSSDGESLLLNGRPTQKDFVAQTWRGAYRLGEISDARVTPVLCFTRAFVEGRISVRGVRVVPIKYLNETLLSGGGKHDFPYIKDAVTSVGKVTGTYPSAVPRRAEK